MTVLLLSVLLLWTLALEEAAKTPGGVPVDGGPAREDKEDMSSIMTVVVLKLV